MSEDPSDPRDVLAQFDLQFERLTFGLRTKVDKDMHDELEEWSNRLTNSKLSPIIRLTIALGLERLEEFYSDHMPSTVRAIRGRRKWLKKRAAIQRIHRAAMELEQDYDPDYYAAMKEYAEERELEWPPAEIDETQIDPTLKRVIDRLKTVLSEQESATLRDVYKNLSGMNADNTREAIIRLEELGAVVLSGSTDSYGSLEIRWTDVQRSD